jgi:hypothetical protein
MNFLDSLMAPLSKDFCLLFYIVGLLGLGLAVLSFVGAMAGFFIYNQKSSYLIGAYLISFLYALFIYYLNRVHYSMCIAALR